MCVFFLSSRSSSYYYHQFDQAVPVVVVAFGVSSTNRAGRRYLTRRVLGWRGSARVLSNDNYTCVELMAKHMCLPTDDDDDEDTTIRGNSSRRGGSKVVRRLFGVIHNCELMRWSRLNETPNRIGNFYCLCVALASAYTLFYSHLCSGRRVLFVIVSVAFN